MNKGDRVQTTAYFIRTFPRSMKGRNKLVGVIVGQSRDHKMWNVLWDGYKTAQMLHPNFIEREINESIAQ